MRDSTWPLQPIVDRCLGNGTDIVTAVSDNTFSSSLARARLFLRARVVTPALRSETLKTLLRALPHNRRFLADGKTTIVIVTWESLEYLAVAIEAIRRHSPEDVQIRVVDNGSTDGTRQWLKERQDVKSTRLPVNIHHGPAMDIGFLLSRTQFVVSMDVDAFPVSLRWMDEVIEPLRNGKLVSGVVTDREFVHPCFLAMEREVFVGDRHTFRGCAGDFTTAEAWDTGESISRRCKPAIHGIDATEHVGPHWVGTSWGDVAYHNMYAVRHFRNYGSEMHDPEAVLDWGITRRDAENAWDLSTRRYLKLGADDRARLTEISHRS